MDKIHRLSRIFQPTVAASKTANITNKEFTSKSQRLMLELGIVQQAVPGCFNYLPLGIKSLNKIITIVDAEMEKIGAAKVQFPSLVKATLWEKSGRLEAMGPELITLRDRHDQKYVLAPTHEETACNLLSNLAPMSYKTFPLLLYQITSKYRDEMKPRFGLIRGREFLMKDLYSFSINEESALDVYNKVCQSYDRIFQRIGVNFIKVVGSSGAMGGNLSHEYHYLADIGDDKILTCNRCDHSTNMELVEDLKCPKCGENSSITEHSAIEVAHTFHLGQKYTKPLNTNYLGTNGKTHLLEQGSYGIGISRLLAASLECLSLEQELRWPDSIAPYNVAILPPKKGSKEEQEIGNLAEHLYGALEEAVPRLEGNIVLDDRTSLTIGKRFIECRRTGIRYVIVLNKKASEKPPVFEVNDIVKNEQVFGTESDIISYIKDNGKFFLQQQQQTLVN